ncbi:hypothetical protein BSQ39_08330 [Loigolactobacillus backii]|uniref:hypothetical protein n=1 Tax=Loigolactobacillus backii TaxID=375175 RepID=UPI000C1CB65B|nr:hypothetical protein [Loigolactobacillus backii]PIO83569.1 hypothetical protein BSQ39_08330 [Loigolactobacillus backii]
MNHEDILAELERYACRHGIKVRWASKLNPHTPPVVSVHFRTIVMNSNWEDKNEYPLQLAHEITHIEDGDPDNLILPYSNVAQMDYGVEYKANRGAIDMLLPYYTETFLDLSELNAVEFMQQFSIPSHLEGYVTSKVNRIIGDYIKEENANY